jgi:hypothetical protein
MSAEKEASMDLKSELAELEGLEGNLDTTTDVSADLVEMKNRMDKSDQEMRAMTDAMKSTLLDVRTLMQDMDNPFAMLRDMGVDKLVNKAVETVEDEVNAKKNMDAMNKMAGLDENDSQAPILAKVEGSTSSHPGAFSQNRAPVAPPAAMAPQSMPQMSAPIANPVASSIAGPGVSSGVNAGASPIANPGESPVASPGVSSVANSGASPIANPVASPVGTPVKSESNGFEAAHIPSTFNGGIGSPSASPVNGVQASGEQVQQLVPRSEPVVENAGSVASAPVAPVSNAVAPQMAPSTEPQYSYFEERLFQTEETVNNLANTMGELIKTIRTQRASPRVKGPIGIGSIDSADYYEAYVGLVSDYMYIRLGDQGAEELLLEGMYKEWASPNVVRDLMDKLSSKKQRRGKAVNSEANVEDRMLITTLLRNLDKPTNQWSESTHLFMLMALVSRAKENTSLGK